MTILLGNCIAVMASMPDSSADFALTDPPYVVRYRDKSGRTLANDDNADWLKPAFRELYRVLKPDSYAVSFYGWNVVDRFMAAWKGAGFNPVEHVVFRKRYASSTRHLKRRHEQAYLLAKGRPPPPAQPIDDVRDDWRYTGNRLHPTQKPVAALKPLIESLTRPGDIVIDPFCGSGSTLVAAHATGRRFIGIEIDPAHHATATSRLNASPRSRAASIAASGCVDIVSTIM